MDNFTIYEDFIPASVGGGYGAKYDDGVRDDQECRCDSECEKGRGTANIDVSVSPSRSPPTLSETFSS